MLVTSWVTVIEVRRNLARVFSGATLTRRRESAEADFDQKAPGSGVQDDEQLVAHPDTWPSGGESTPPMVRSASRSGEGGESARWYLAHVLWSIRRHSTLARLAVTVAAIGAVGACSSDDSSSNGSVTPEQFAAQSKSAATSLTNAVAPGETKVMGICPYQAVFAQFVDLGVTPKVTAANVDVNSAQTGGVDIVCETANAQIAVGTYDPKVLTTELLAAEATSVTPTPYGTIYVFPKYIFQQPDKYVQYAWLLTPELFVGVAVPPTATPQLLIDRLTAAAPALVTLTVAVKSTDLA